jgi:tripartite ATP-independent transporter DctP family solute receptor
MPRCDWNKTDFSKREETMLKGTTNRRNILDGARRLFAAAILASAGGFAAPAVAADYELSINTALATSDPLYRGLEAFQKNVAGASKGRIEVKLFPNSQLGPDEDVLEQARAGAPVAVVVDGGRLAVFQKEFGVLGAPFLASGYDGIRKVVTSDMFEGWVKNLHDNGGLQILSFNWWQGERHLLTKKEVNVPADLSGIRMRTPGAPVWTGTVTAMGATPTPMPWGEVYSAISSNVIDGAEAQFPAIMGAKLYEVISHITKTGHINLITGLVTSGPWFDSLPDDLKKVLRDEALKAGDIASYGTRDSLGQIEADLKAKGISVRDVDVTPFREATAKVYDDLGYGDLRDKLRAMAAN